MGQTLTEPVTAKESSFLQNDQYRVGSSAMQGWRVNMEDSHTHILSLPDDPAAAFFAVYDGHGGAHVAEYSGKHLHKFIIKRPEYEKNIAEAMKKGFLDIDAAMLNDQALREQMAGSTAVAVLIKDDKLYCANAGDSRAIACIDGELETLSLDHKPNNETEYKRICTGGGYVEFNRVNGNLALSRALGDFEFKKNTSKGPEEQVVTAYPDVEVREITEDWEFAVLACDGIWDVLSNLEVINFVRRQIGEGLYPEEICENLMTRCLAPDCQMGGLGGDNMTVILVCFLHGRPYEDLIERCKTSLVPGITSTPPTDEIHAGEGDLPAADDAGAAEVATFDSQQPSSAKVTTTPVQHEDADNNEALTNTTTNTENGAGDTNQPASEVPEPPVQDKIEITDSEPVDVSTASAEPDLK